ncbi:PilZ domain-containing protein [Sphingomonas sp. DT-51]|uniref:PilZ domain-containing protein n=1 Tax=Sphingomonas sp. DT-51 TaxID=3396165 RepID=UPI003F198E19
MLLHAVLVNEDSDERRGAERQTINQPSTLRGERGAHDVYVADLSETGFSVTTDSRIAIGSTVTIGLAGHGRAMARVVRQVPGGYGCEFAMPLSPSVVASAFRNDTVIQLTSSAPLVAAFPDPVVKKLPGAVRLGVVLGSSALLWALIARGVAALL